MTRQRRWVGTALEAPTVGQRLDRPEMVAKYPILTTIPHETTLLRMLELDDAKSFAG